MTFTNNKRKTKGRIAIARNNATKGYQKKMAEKLTKNFQKD